ncbi:hypothetical protein CMI42_03270 [Candidatus Pacearchaeota archaeon]|nr:hypothetical protein [Candidatus Pacearchaeota archaeon]|tara:strand:+ start:226 stop:627 length:402 start_codon:yes stop_codon:yes gene_type:complete
MAKKQVWVENLSQWQERNLSANRIAVNTIRKKFGKRKFTLSEMQQVLKVDRKTAWNWLYLLRVSRFVNSKSIGPRRMLDNRWYQLSNKGIKNLPKKKGIKKEVEVREVVKKVPVEKTKTIEFEDRYVKTWKKR